MRTAPGGDFPLNTNGGGLSYTHTGMYGMFAIQALCKDVIWMHEGRIVMRDEPEAVIDAYNEFLEIGETDAADDDV